MRAPTIGPTNKRCAASNCSRIGMRPVANTRKLRNCTTLLTTLETRERRLSRDLRTDAARENPLNPPSLSFQNIDHISTGVDRLRRMTTSHLTRADVLRQLTLS